MISYKTMSLGRPSFLVAKRHAAPGGSETTCKSRTPRVRRGLSKLERRTALDFAQKHIEMMRLHGVIDFGGILKVVEQASGDFWTQGEESKVVRFELLGSEPGAQGRIVLAAAEPVFRIASESLDFRVSFSNPSYS